MAWLARRQVNQTGFNDVSAREKVRDSVFSQYSLFTLQQLIGHESFEGISSARRDVERLVEVQGVLVIQAVSMVMLEDLNNGLVTGGRRVERAFMVTFTVIRKGRIESVCPKKHQMLRVLEVRHNKCRCVESDGGTEEVRWKCYIHLFLPQERHTLTIGSFYFQQIVQWFYLMDRQVRVVK